MKFSQPVLAVAALTCLQTTTAAPIPAVEARLVKASKEKRADYGSYGTYDDIPAPADTPAPTGGYGSYGSYDNAPAPSDTPTPTGGYGSYGSYDNAPAPSDVPAPAGGYGSYGSYDNAPAPSDVPAPADGYGSYGNYGAYKRAIIDFVKGLWS